MRRRVLPLAPVFTVAFLIAAADDAPIGLADLETYQAALAAKPAGAVAKVGFRDLWDRPEAFGGKAVAVEGRLARVFRQPSVGEFPPLAEAWVVSPAGDPFCLVFPVSEAGSSLEIGSSVAFAGTFLKRIRYQGGDVARLAPLIVGPEPPAVRSPATGTSGTGWSSADWMTAAVGSLVVGLFLVRRHLSRPPSIRRPHEPPPTFVDGDPGPGPGPEEDWHETGV